MNSESEYSQMRDLVIALEILKNGGPPEKHPLVMRNPDLSQLVLSIKEKVEGKKGAEDKNQKS